MILIREKKIFKKRGREFINFIWKKIIKEKKENEKYFRRREENYYLNEREFLLSKEFK